MAARSDIVRAGATPEFVTLCKTLYGDLIDPDEIWHEVFKSSPDQADVHANTGMSTKQKIVRGASLIGTAAGAIVAGKELVKAPGVARRILPGLALGADGLAGGIQYNDARKQAALVPTGSQVGKSGSTPAGDTIPPLKDVVTGALKQTKKIVGQLQPTGAGATVPAAPMALAGPKKLAPTPLGNQSSEFSGGKSADDIEWSGTFSKFDDDKHLAFGWASVSKVNGQPVVDAQGDYIDPNDLEDAAYEYMLSSRIGGAMHQRDAWDRPVKVADIVESMVFTDDKVSKMGLPDDFNRGWWIGMKIHDENEWTSVRKGQDGTGFGRCGFSIHGNGVRKDQDIDELMGYAYA